MQVAKVRKTPLNQTCALIVALLLPSQAFADGANSIVDAVGRLNIAGFKTRAMCTATLVAPDKILTSAHCTPRDEIRLPDMRFVAGWNRGEYVAVRGIKSTLVHPRFTAPNAENVPFDIAILTLTEPITDIPPVDVSDTPEQTSHMTGYTRSRPHQITELGPCPLTSLGEGVVYRIDCPTEPGFSGGPVLHQKDGRWVLSAVTSASNAASTFAVPVAQWAAGALANAD